MNHKPPPAAVTVIGGGLAGVEAALFLARHGVRIRLFEMRPGTRTAAHETPHLAELVCSNSLRSDSADTGPGLLKEEMRRFGSQLLLVADACSVPAGMALAVDREMFASSLTRRVEEEPRIELIREEVRCLNRKTRRPVGLPEGSPAKPASSTPADLSSLTSRPPGLQASTPCLSEDLLILCPGPLASEALMKEVEGLVGKDRLFFFDAISPIVDADSLDRSRLFQGSRYQDGEGDYLNAPMNESQYLDFVETLVAAEKFVPHGFDREDALPLFSGCEPVEAIAARGPLTLAHGPMRYRGFRMMELGYPDAVAVVQLRAENRHRTAYNLVGFQTRLTQAEQRRVFRMIPGLERAQFLRYGSLHRNSYLDTPRLANADLSLRADDGIFVAGQFAGAEGYIESAALGLLAGLFALARLRGEPPPVPPDEMAFGGLMYHVTCSSTRPLQPSNIHFGLLPPVQAKGKHKKRAAMVKRARAAVDVWLADLRAKGLFADEEEH